MSATVYTQSQIDQLHTRLDALGTALRSDIEEANNQRERSIIAVGRDFSNLQEAVRALDDLFLTTAKRVTALENELRSVRDGITRDLDDLKHDVRAMQDAALT